MKKESVVKLASQVKFDDCKSGSNFSQSDISKNGIGTLRKCESGEARANLALNRSLATGSTPGAIPKSELGKSADRTRRSRDLRSGEKVSKANQPRRTACVCDRRSRCRGSSTLESWAIEADTKATQSPGSINQFSNHERYKCNVRLIAEDPELSPVYATLDSAGADVKANIQENIIIAPGASVLIPTGLKLEVPVGYEIQVRPRSGLALRHQVTVLNSPGTVDSDYRGELGVILINHGREPFIVTPRMRIAQIVLASVVQAEFILEDTLAASTRGVGGFGHTGTH